MASDTYTSKYPDCEICRPAQPARWRGSCVMITTKKLNMCSACWDEFGDKSKPHTRWSLLRDAPVADPPFNRNGHWEWEAINGQVNVYSKEGGRYKTIRDAIFWAKTHAEHWNLPLFLEGLEVVPIKEVELPIQRETRRLPFQTTNKEVLE